MKKSIVYMNIQKKSYFHQINQHAAFISLRFEMHRHCIIFLNPKLVD